MDFDEFKKSLEDAKKALEPRTFKFELLICFWLALYLKRVEIASYLV